MATDDHTPLTFEPVMETDLLPVHPIRIRPEEAILTGELFGWLTGQEMLGGDKIEVTVAPQWLVMRYIPADGETITEIIDIAALAGRWAAQIEVTGPTPKKEETPDVDGA